MKQLLSLLLSVTLLCTAMALGACRSHQSPPETGESGTTGPVTPPATQPPATLPPVTEPPATEPSEPQPPTDSAFTGTPTEILEAILARAGELDSDQEYGLNSISWTPTVLTSADAPRVLGISEAEFAANVVAAVEEVPGGSWYPDSIFLLQIKEGVDVAAFAHQVTYATKGDRFGSLVADAIVGNYTGQYVIVAVCSASGAEAVRDAVHELSSLPTVAIERENDWEHPWID